MGEPLVSVVVACKDHHRELGNLLESLERQTLDRDRFEVLVVDDGSDPPIEEPGDGVTLLRQAQAGPAAARNAAIAEARSPLLLFANADGVLAPDALERHVAAHPPGAPARAVLGRFDWLREQRTAFVEVAQRAGVLFPYQWLTPGEPASHHFFWTGNLSVPAEPVRAVGGFDEGFARAMWEDVDLGLRLARRGVPLVYDPSIGCDHDHPMTLRGWLRREEWVGHEWVRFAHTHGGRAFAILGGDDEPTEAFAETLLGGLLHQHDAHAERTFRLRTLLDEMDAAIAEDPARREAVLDARGSEATELVGGLATVARMAGICGGILGYTPDARAARARRLRQRVAAVHTVAGPEDLEATPRVLDVLPRSWSLLVCHRHFLPPDQVPRDERIRPVRLGAAGGEPWAPLLAASDADAFVFLEGAPTPTTGRLATLVRFLGVSPRVGAVALGRPRGERQAVGVLRDRVPRHAVATTRDVLAGDTDRRGSFLDRLAGRGLAQAVVVPPGDPVG